MSSPEAYRCGPSTSAKQEGFRHIVAKTLAIITAIRSDPDKWYARFEPPIFIDLFAGPGIDDQGNVGSPLIFAEIAAKLPYPVEAHFYEKDAETVKQLAYHLSQSSFNRLSYTVHPADNSAVCDLLPRLVNHQRYGIAYADPSNADLNLVFDRFRKIARIYRRVDLLLNYAPASWKRQKQLEHYTDLVRLMPTIEKQKWLIREPIGRHQWTMLWATNYIDYRADESKHWFDTKSKRGSELLRKIAFTRQENRNFKQERLFND